MTRTTDGLPDGLAAALARVELSWDELVAGASDVVLFGSRACGLERDGSDWDILCVGRGPVRPRSGVDIVWVGPRTLTTERWLGSELAGHVLAFGRPLMGICAWMAEVHPSESALRLKRRRVIARIAGLSRIWRIASPALRRRQVTFLRRELQRAARLEEGLPVPPAAQLDAGWNEEGEPAERWAQLTRWMSADESAAALKLGRASWAT